MVSMPSRQSPAPAPSVVCEGRAISSWPRYFEGGPASASAGCIRIHDLKTHSSQTVVKIQGGAAQIRRAFIVDEKLDPVAFHHFISGLLFVERHLVMQSRATALRDLHAQPFTRYFSLCLEQAA